MAQSEPAPAFLEASAHLEAFGLLSGEGEVRLVCDTNVYLNAREAIGVTEDGRLRIALGQANESPDVAVLRAGTIAGIPVRFILAVPVQNELFYLIRGGYEQRPQGLEDGRLTAVALRNLMSLHPLGSVEPGGPTVEAQLPDPPLSSAEKNDRHIWFQAEDARAMLITSDGTLLKAVREQTGRELAALRPIELIDLAAAFARSLGLDP